MVPKTESCVICGEIENNRNKLLICSYCSRPTHLKCMKSSNSMKPKNKDNKLFCSSKCLNDYIHENETRNANDTMMSLISTNLQSAIIKVTQNMKESVRSVTAVIEKSQEFLASKFDLILDEFKKLKAENDQLKRELQNLKNNGLLLTNMVHKLEANSDKTAKTSIVANAIFHGIPQKSNEDVKEIVRNVINDVLDTNLPSDAIVSASRLCSNAVDSNAVRPVRVVFKDVTSKNQVFLKKKQIGKVSSNMINPQSTQNGRTTNIIIRDELTPLSSALFKEIRENKSKLGIKYVWTGKGGVVLIRESEFSKPIAIQNRNDLNRLFRQQTKSF